MKFKVGQQVRVKYDNHWGGGCFDGEGEVFKVYPSDNSYDILFKKGSPSILVGTRFSMKEYVLSPIGSIYNKLLEEAKE